MNRNEAKAKLVEYGITETEAEAMICRAESSNCEPTGRLQPDWDTTVEFKASAVNSRGDTGVDVLYFPEASEIEAAGDDLGNVDWVIAEYRVW